MTRESVNIELPDSNRELEWDDHLGEGVLRSWEVEKFPKPEPGSDLLVEWFFDDEDLHYSCIEDACPRLAEALAESRSGAKVCGRLLEFKIVPAEDGKSLRVETLHAIWVEG
jgi:hypothetical protein